MTIICIKGRKILSVYYTISPSSLLLSCSPLPLPLYLSLDVQLFVHANIHYDQLIVSVGKYLDADTGMKATKCYTNDVSIVCSCKYSCYDQLIVSIGKYLDADTGMKATKCYTNDVSIAMFCR